jgi:hypothetical protein
VVHILIWDKRKCQINEYSDMDIVDLQYSKYSHLLSDLSCKFKLSMTIFNYKNVKT